MDHNIKKNRANIERRIAHNNQHANNESIHYHKGTRVLTRAERNKKRKANHKK